MPWIHIEDVVGLLLHGATRSEIEGPLNICAPEPVRNADFARTLAHVMRRPSFFRAPAAALRVALGDMADVVLASSRVIPKKAIATGYAFRFVELDEALRNLASTSKADN